QWLEPTRRTRKASPSETFWILPNPKTDAEFAENGSNHDPKAHTDCGGAETRAIAPTTGALEAVGSVSFRAPVGHSSRGLQRLRNRVGLFPSRSRALAHLPLGRRRHCRNLRSPSIHLLCAVHVEWPRSDLEGASVRTDR